MPPPPRTTPCTTEHEPVGGSPTTARGDPSPTGAAGVGATALLLHLPLELAEALEHRASAEGLPVDALVIALLLRGLDPEGHREDRVGLLADEVVEVCRAVEHLAGRVELLTDAVQDLRDDR